MRKRFIQFMLMLMVAIVPYTATPFVMPASADVCVSVDELNPCVPGGTIGGPLADCVGNGLGQCCQHANPHGNGCAPDCYPYCQTGTGTQTATEPSPAP